MEKSLSIIILVTVRRLQVIVLVRMDLAYGFSTWGQEDKEPDFLS